MCKYLNKALKIAAKYGLTVYFSDDHLFGGGSSYNYKTKVIIIRRPGIYEPDLDREYDQVLTLLHEIGHAVEDRLKSYDEIRASYNNNPIRSESYASRWAIRIAKRIGYKGNFEFLRLAFETYTKAGYYDDFAVKCLYKSLARVKRIEQ